MLARQNGSSDDSESKMITQRTVHFHVVNEKSLLACLSSLILTNLIQHANTVCEEKQKPYHTDNSVMPLCHIYEPRNQYVRPLSQHAVYGQQLVSMIPKFKIDVLICTLSKVINKPGSIPCFCPSTSFISKLQRAQSCDSESQMMSIQNCTQLLLNNPLVHITAEVANYNQRNTKTTDSFDARKRLMTDTRSGGPGCHDGTAESICLLKDNSRP